MIIDDEDSEPEEENESAGEEIAGVEEENGSLKKFKKIKALEDSDDEMPPKVQSRTEPARQESDDQSDSGEKLNLSFQNDKDVYDAESSDEDFPGALFQYLNNILWQKHLK